MWGIVGGYGRSLQTAKRLSNSTHLYYNISFARVGFRESVKTRNFIKNHALEIQTPI